MTPPRNENPEAISLFAGQEEIPTFSAPWQAQAFSMTIKLYEEGHFDWKEWTHHLGAEIALAKKCSDPHTNDTYYACWLRALERLVTEKGLASQLELQSRRDAWARAARATPHGEVIHLEAESQNLTDI
mgnify:FL=1